MVRLICLTFCLLFSILASAQNNFRSRQTGDWNQSSTWEEFIAGSWQLTANTPDFSDGSISILNSHIVTITANVTIDQTIILIGGRIDVNDGVVITLNNGAATDLRVVGILNFIGESYVEGVSSSIIVNANGSLRLGSLNPAGALITGTTEGNIRVANRQFEIDSRVVYSGTGSQFIGNGHPGGSSPGLITEISNASGVTFNNTTTGNSGTGRLRIPSTLILTSGNLNIVSIAGAGNSRTLQLDENVVANGNFITFSGPSTNLAINGSGAFGTFPFPGGSQVIGSFDFNRTGGSIAFANSLTFNSDVFITDGTVDFNGTTSITGEVSLGNSTTLFFEGQTLSLGNNFTSAGGVLSSNAASSLLLTGSVGHTSPLTFTGGSALNTLSMTMTNAGTSATIGSALTVTTALNLNDGILSNVGGNLSLNNGSTVTKSSEGSVITSNLSGSSWNLIYTGGSQSTGFEIPVSGLLNSLAINTGNGSTITLNQSINIVNAFTIPSSNRTFTSGNNNVAAGSLTNFGIFNAPGAGASTGLTLSGNLVNNGTFNHNNGTVVVASPSVWSGTTINTTNFNSISVTAAGILTPGTTLNIRGNFTNDGSFNAGTGLVIFNGGVSTLSGTAMPTTDFNNVTINTGATLVPASNFILLGNLVVSGTFTAGSGTITFDGNTTLTGTNINTTIFNHVVITTGSTLVSPVTFNVSGNLTIDGTYTAGSRTIVFTGTTLMAGTAINATNFYNVMINPGANVTAPAQFNIQGNLTTDGLLATGTGTVTFMGNSGSKILTGTTNTQFYDLGINKSNGGTSVSISSPQTVTNSLTLADGIVVNTGGNLTMNAGTFLTRASTGTITTASPSGGPWNLTYTNLTLTTGLEIPASGNLLSLTIDVNNTRTVTLSQSITVQNALTILNAGRTLNSSTHDVSVGSFSSNGTFVAPSSAAPAGLTVIGDFDNNGTFTHNNGLTTFVGTTDLSGSSLTNFNRITISGTLNALVDFAAAGSFTNNGSFSAGTTTVSFTGTALQNITGTAPLTTFNNITISNIASPVSVSVQSNVDLIGILTLGANAKFDADGSSDAAVFTLLSTDDFPVAEDASIAALPATAQVIGDVTVQRFFRPADNFDRFISSPISDGPVSQLQAATPLGTFPVTGGFTGTSFPCTGCNNNGHNLRYYREADAGPINTGYKGWITTSNAQTLVPGVGYDAYMWNGVANTTISYRGTINRGNINLGIVTTPASNSITHTSNGVPAADGWNLVGNPYPSAIQWNNGAGWSRTNIDPTVWVWDVVGRVWHSFNANTLVGDLTNGVIATGQGFWVYAPSPGAASITINEQAKSTSGTGSYYRQRENTVATLKVSLQYLDFTDNAFLLIDENATQNFDIGLDAPKLQLGIERLSVSLMDPDDNKLAHYAVNEVAENEIPVSILAEAEGDYTLSFNSINNFPDFEQYYLIDSYLNISSKISEGGYHFEMNSTSLANTTRFHLSRNPVVQPEYTIQIICYPNPTSGQLSIEVNSENVQDISLISQVGTVVRSIPFEVVGNLTKADVNMSDCSRGIYFIKVVTKGKLFIEKIAKY